MSLLANDTWQKLFNDFLEKKKKELLHGPAIFLIVTKQFIN